MLESLTPDRKATVLLLLAVAGFVDAVGLAETGRYFVSYMSGNTTQMGLALGAGAWASALLPLGLVALFVGGATMGTLIVEQMGRRGPATLLLVEAALLGLAYAAATGTPRPMLGLVMLPIAMGLANIVTLRAGGSHPGATYATGTLVKLGIAIAGLGAGVRPMVVLFPFAMWLALLAGSVLGAVGRLRYGSDALLGPIAMLLVLAIVHLFAARRPTA
jgi:uncharacterized membrane protein YoaK (UPF0700 family)